MNATPDVLDAKECAALLRLNYLTVLKYAKARKIPCQWIGDLPRFSREAVLAWLAGGGRDLRSGEK